MAIKEQLKIEIKNSMQDANFRIYVNGKRVKHNQTDDIVTIIESILVHLEYEVEISDIWE